LCLWITSERGVQHDRFGLVFQVENPRNPTRSVVDVRNQVQDDLRLIRQADFGQIINKMTAAAVVLILEREDRLPALRRRRLLPEG
jgi:hypothetical protein